MGRRRIRWPRRPSLRPPRLSDVPPCRLGVRYLSCRVAFGIHGGDYVRQKYVVTSVLSRSSA
ncbi:hypothetical protein J3E61_006928 [Mycobacterium sp. OAE908]